MIQSLSSRVVLGSVLGLLLVTGAYAHHGWGSYDAAKLITIASNVERADWENPHVMLVVSYQGKDWEAVLAPPFRMGARGLTADMIKPGTAVRIEGYPSTRVATEMRAERIIVAGKTYELR